MSAPKTPRAAALRNQIDLLLTDISMMSAEELIAMGVKVEIIPPVPREEVAHRRGFHPLTDAYGRVRPAPRAE